MSTLIIVEEINKSWLFGLIQLQVVVEDRRPDMGDHTNLTKYKTQVYFKYFGKTWSIIVHSKSISHMSKTYYNE